MDFQIGASVSLQTPQALDIHSSNKCDTVNQTQKVTAQDMNMRNTHNQTYLAKDAMTMRKVEAALTIQRFVRGHQSRTAFHPKIKHNNVLSARQGVLRRAQSAIGRHYWGNPMKAIIKGGQSFYFSVYEEGKMETGFTMPFSKKIFNTTEKIGNIIENWPFPEKNKDEIVAQNTVKLPDNIKVVAPNTYSSMVNAPHYYQRHFHEKLTSQDDIHLNCVQFVLLTLYLEGIIDLKALQNPDFANALQLEKMVAIESMFDKLDSGDILTLVNRKTGKLEHTCFFHGFEGEEDDMLVVQIGNSTISPHVTMDYVDIDNPHYKLEVLPLSQFF
jgi:hypothetical protein